MSGKELVYPRLSPALLNNRSGVSLVEVLVAGFILLMVVAALFFILNIGNLTSVVSTAKLEVQQEARRAMDWMVRDLRQTKRMEQMKVTAGAEPEPKQFNELAIGQAFTKPQFKLPEEVVCAGANASVEWSDYRIEYKFDADNNKIIRTKTDLQCQADDDCPKWEFNHISDLTFTKTDTNVLRIAITGAKTARGSIRPSVTLETEVKLRN